MNKEITVLKSKGEKAFENCYKCRQNSSLYPLSSCLGKMSHTKYVFHMLMTHFPSLNKITFKA